MRDLQTKCFRQDVSKLEAMGGEDGRQGVDDGGVAELETGGGESGGIGATAGKEGFVGHFAEGEAESEGRDGEKGGAMELLGESAGELGVGDGVGRGEVEGT
jgi:hypothetical protein